MLSISNMTSEQAAHYHKQDQNYYSQNGEIGQWQGKAAEALGLNGAIDHAQFERLCHGINPNSDEVLVNTSKRAGTDLTFSAPKSVSMIMELSSKEDELAIRQAHDLAVSKAIAHIEENYSQTREQFNGFRETINTGNLCVAKFQHDTSRELDPQLHTHAFVLNMTQKENGEWRALHNDELFKNKLYLGQVYRNELALQLKELGYSIEVTNAKQGLFEVKGVSKELMDSFSQRAKQVESKLEELKKEYPNAKEGDLIQMAKLDSRKAKDKTVDRTVIRADNINKAKEIVNIEEMLLNVKNQSQEHTVLSSKEILNQAKTILTDKESVFTKEELLKESMKLSLGTYNKDDFEEAIKIDSELVNFEKNIYSTKEMIEIEKQIIEQAKQGQNSYRSIETNDSKVNSALSKYTLTAGQAAAAKEILTNHDMILNIQGDAGVGKTYMLNVVNEYVNQSSTKYTLQGLSFTGKAADEIEKEANIKSSTLHSFLSQKEFKNNQIYIVDEASMVGSKQMHELMQKAQETKSKIVLIGDIKQFQTISAGGIFEQLQKQAFVKTVEMTESMRAKTVLMKSLYADIKNKDIVNAFNRLNDNDMVKQTTQIEEVKNEYLKQQEEQKETLLLVSKNKDRSLLNELIRDELKERIKDEVKMEIKEAITLQDTEKFFAQYYKEGQNVFINKAIDGLKAGSEALIKSVNHQTNILTLLSNNKEIEVDLTKQGNKLSLFTTLEKSFGVGEKITFTKNDKKFDIKNGQIATVLEIKDNIMKVLNGNKELSIDTKQYNYFDYGYALTDYKSQGQTAQNVIAMVDSDMSNLNSFYVQVTRAKEGVKIFTDSIEKLQENTQNQQVKGSTLEYLHDNAMQSSNRFEAAQKNVISMNISDGYSL
ncbi:MAG: MobF family relaxase [Sulfurimonadaceae bacterium]